MSDVAFALGVAMGLAVGFFLGIYVESRDELRKLNKPEGK